MSLFDIFKNKEVESESSQSERQEEIIQEEIVIEEPTTEETKEEKKFETEVFDRGQFINMLTNQYNATAAASIVDNIYEGKKADKTYTDDEYYFVHSGMLDIFNFSTPAKVKYPVNNVIGTNVFTSI